MAKKLAKKTAHKVAPNKTIASTIDVIALGLAIIYFQSVLTVAHHTSFWVHNGSTHIVESPAVTLLLASLTLTGYALYSTKLTITKLNIVTLTILATTSLFWLSGLRTNFYF